MNNVSVFGRIKPLRLLSLALLVLLLAAGCGNGGNQGHFRNKTNDTPCGITPELRKLLNKYSIVQEGKCGLWLVNSKKTKYSEKGYPYHPFGCVDKEGKVVIPLEYDEGFEGSGVICVCNHDKKWGMFNLSGNEIVPCVYDHINFFYGDFTIVKQGNQYGILNNKGELVVPVQYDYIECFYSHLYHSYGSEKYCFEDVFYLTKNGNTTVVNLSRSKGSINREHIDTPYDYQVIQRDGKIVIVNYLGNETTPYPYQKVRLDELSDLFPDRLAAVVKNNKIGFIDMQGNVKIPFKFYYSEFWFNLSANSSCIFSEGLAAMMNSGKKWGYINNAGNITIPYEYDWAYPFHKGSALVAKGNSLGLIDKNNKVILPFEFEDGFFTGNVYVLCKNGKWGVYSPQGQCITPCQYDNIGPFIEGYATVVKDGKQGLIDEQGQVVIPFEYETCMYDVWSNLVYVVKEGKWGILDLNNQVLVPIKYDQVGVCDNTKCNLFVVEKDGKRGLYDRCGNSTLD